MRRGRGNRRCRQHPHCVSVPRPLPYVWQRDRRLGRGWRQRSHLVSRNLHDRATLRQECGNDQMIGTILTAGLQGSCHEERWKGLFGRWGRKSPPARRRSHTTGSENGGRAGRVNCVSLDTFEWRKAQDAAEVCLVLASPQSAGFHHGTECRRARGMMRTMIYE